jgi:nucleoside-diphosphate-sugar epimerase
MSGSRDVNVNGTRTVVEAGAAEGVKRFVHGSSIGV